MKTFLEQLLGTTDLPSYMLLPENKTECIK
jgi:hypothetical protein